MRLEFRSRVPLRDTMVFEQAYHPNLQLSLREKRQLLSGALVIWLLNTDRQPVRLVGEIYGVAACTLDLHKDFEQGGTDIRPFVKPSMRALYVYSTTILPRWCNRGLGSLLKANFLGRAAELGYQWVIGHAREGSSQKLNARFGAVWGARHADWYNTGESYRFYSLRLE